MEFRQSVIPRSPASRATVFIVGLACVAAGTLLCWEQRTGDFGEVDALQYWTASKLLSAHINPYDARAFALFQQQYSSSPVSYFYLSPIINPVLLFFSWSDFQQFAPLWFFCMSCASACAVILCASRSELRISSFAWLLFLPVWFPAFLAFSYGQISPLLSLAIIAGIFGLEAHRQKLSGTATYLLGVLAALALAKPHLWILLAILVMPLFSQNSLSRKVGTGFAVGAAALVLTAEFLCPGIISWYTGSLGRVPLDFKTPTLGSWLQEFSTSPAPLIRSVPLIGSVLVAGLAILLGFRPTVSWLIRWGLPLSLAASPYGWTYDHMVLIASYAEWLRLLSTAKEQRLFASLVCLGHVAMISTATSSGLQQYVWYPFLFPFAGALTMKVQKTARN